MPAGPLPDSEGTLSVGAGGFSASAGSWGSTDWMARPSGKTRLNISLGQLTWERRGWLLPQVSHARETLPPWKINPEPIPTLHWTCNVMTFYD
jgi:hypothetical protein